MTTGTAKNEPGTDEIARELLAAWAKRYPSAAASGFSKKVEIVSVTERPVLAAFLRSLYDVRSIQEKILPFNESSPPDKGDKSDPYSFPDKLRKEFIDQEAVLTLAEDIPPMSCGKCESGDGPNCKSCSGAQKIACKECFGKGNKGCTMCSGEGKLICTGCKGKGKIVSAMGNDGMRREGTCPQCAGAGGQACPDCGSTAPDCNACRNERMIVCEKCRGSGKQPCSNCSDFKQLVPGFIVTIAHKVAYHRSFVRHPEVPEGCFPADPPPGKLGEKVVDLEADKIVADAEIDPIAKDAATKVLAQAKNGHGPKSKLIRQALTVELVPVYDIAFRYEGKDYRAWATRYQNRVVCENDPFSDQLRQTADDAATSLARGDVSRYESTLKKGLELAPNDPGLLALKSKNAVKVKLARLNPGDVAAAAAAVVSMMILAMSSASNHRFWPVLTAGLIILGAAIVAARLLPRYVPIPQSLTPGQRYGLSAATAAVPAVLAMMLFALINPPRRLDARDFKRLVDRYEILVPDRIEDKDEEDIQNLISRYELLGVNVQPARTILDTRRRYLDDLHQAELKKQEDLRRQQEEAKRLRAEQARKEKEAAAKKAAAKKAAEAAAKKKKKKKGWFR